MKVRVQVSGKKLLTLLGFIIMVRARTVIRLIVINPVRSVLPPQGSSDYEATSSVRLGASRARAEVRGADRRSVPPLSSPVGGAPCERERGRGGMTRRPSLVQARRRGGPGGVPRRTGDGGAPSSAVPRSLTFRSAAEPNL